MDEETVNVCTHKWSTEFDLCFFLQKKAWFVFSFGFGFICLSLLEFRYTDHASLQEVSCVNTLLYLSLFSTFVFDFGWKRRSLPLSLSPALHFEAVQRLGSQQASGLFLDFIRLFLLIDLDLGSSVFYNYKHGYFYLLLVTNL